MNSTTDAGSTLDITGLKGDALLGANRRSDTHRFLEGDEAVESATWEQCGGLVHALETGQVADERAVAARVAARLFELVPTHYRPSAQPVLRQPACGVVKWQSMAKRRERRQSRGIDVAQEAPPRRAPRRLGPR
ncbi:MAG TPA: hypothetical protein VHM25_22270 [Polyangiaceae bacterium]|nr:hypothetical protein [Polyangiaceae bacterium]